MARPVVSTALGAEGLAITPGRDILIADDAEGFTDPCARSAGPGRPGNPLLGQAGRDLVQNRHRRRPRLRGLLIFRLFYTGRLPGRRREGGRSAPS